MAKPRVTRVPSDTCVVTINGEVYHPHEGEWIDVIPAPQTVAERQAMVRLQIAGKKLRAASGDEDEQEQVDAFLEGDFGMALRIAAKRIVAWNWTDMRGEQLPQPDGNAAVLRELSDEELGWLIGACNGRPPEEEVEEEKKDSASSLTTSSATEPPPTLTSSSTAHSPTKRSSARLAAPLTSALATPNGRTTS